MKKSVELRKQLSTLDMEIRSILDLVKEEKRSFNDAEKTDFDAKFEQAEELRSQIKDAEKVEAFEARTAGNTGVAAPSLITGKGSQYSIVGHINAVRSGKVDGIFAEAQAEALQELRN